MTKMVRNLAEWCINTLGTTLGVVALFTFVLTLGFFVFAFLMWILMWVLSHLGIVWAIYVAKPWYTVWWSWWALALIKILTGLSNISSSSSKS